MIFSKIRPVKIVMIGAGGTGGHIAPHLYRLLYALERPVQFVICDGDIVEEKNLVRQNFTKADLGLNKARVVAERYSNVFGLETSYVPDFIENAEKLEELIAPRSWRTGRFVTDPKTYVQTPETISELVILIGAVDNNRSRQLCHEVFLAQRNWSTLIPATESIPDRWCVVSAAAEKQFINRWARSIPIWPSRTTCFHPRCPARTRRCPHPRRLQPISWPLQRW